MPEYIKIEWYDVVAEEDAEKRDIDGKKPVELLAHKRNTFGYVYREDEEAIILCRDEDDEMISYLAIPKCLIKHKEILRVEQSPKPSELPPM